MASDMLDTLLWFGEVYSEVKIFLVLAIVLVGFITLSWIVAKWFASKLQATDDSDVRPTDESRERATDESREQATNEFKGVLDAGKLSHELIEVVDWYQLGLNLGLPKHDLDKIQQNYHLGNNRQRLEMLDLWLRRTPNAARGDVVSALEKMGENTIAENMRQKDKGGGK